jgi:hypothetical protein
VFATVGFGDITAKTEAARLLVTGQMITDLIILGLGARVIVARSRVAGNGSRQISRLTRRATGPVHGRLPLGLRLSVCAPRLGPQGAF